MPDSVIAYDDSPAHAQRALPAELWRSLHERARQLGIADVTICRAAWAIVLSRYAREAWVRVGVAPDAGPGFRVHVAADLSVDDFLRAVAHAAPADHAHDELPLFESSVLLELPDGNRAASSEAPACSLAISVEHGAALQLRAQFDRRRFQDDVVERLLGSLCFVFEQLTGPGPRPVSAIEVVPADEREKIVAVWNDTARPLPEALLIHGLFERRVSEQPQAIALEFMGERVSYAELERRANQMAHALRGLGARPGVFVGVCVERGVPLVVSLLAVVKSGAAYVPLDPREPKPRLASMLADAGARSVIVQAPQRALFAAEVTLIDADAREFGSMPPTPPTPSARSSDACYAIFTSGSTGRPNGVVLSHRAVANTLDWVNRTFQVGPRDRSLFVTSQCFDLSVYDIFGVLGAGGTVVIASDAQLADPRALARSLQGDGITIWNSAPVALQRVVGDLTDASSPAALRLVLLSGDWIPVRLPDATRRCFPGAQVVGLGGATEAAIWSNWFPIARVDPSWTSIPYGRPIQNARYYVLDERMRPVPVGVAGDLYIGGACLAEGYLDRPQLNRERFVRDPFAGDDADARLYKTGDLARYFVDGNLEFLGRSDFQVKIRGFRVEVGEVEAALLALPGVRYAVCSASADASGEKSLIAYVVPEPEQAADPVGWRQALAGALPAFMLPSRVICVRELPLSSHGKVDRRALQLCGDAEPARTIVAPRNDLERSLVELWQAALGHSPIGVTDDFFEVGGHSMLALKVVEQSRTALGLSITLPRFLEHPTIEGVLRQCAADGGTAEVVTGDVYSYHAAGKRPPIALLSGGPFALLYREFAKLFGTDQPVHLVHTRGADAHGIDAEAARCEAQLQAVCASGPVIVGGFGALAPLALALAQRLQARGRLIPLLIGVDPTAPDGSSTTQNLLRRLADVGRRARWSGAGAVDARPRLLAELLVIRAEDGGPADASAIAELCASVAGPACVLPIRGQHMGFLADGDHQRVIDEIVARVDRLT